MAEEDAEWIDLDKVPGLKPFKPNPNKPPRRPSKPPGNRPRNPDGNNRPRKPDPEGPFYPRDAPDTNFPRLPHDEKNHSDTLSFSLMIAGIVCAMTALLVLLYSCWIKRRKNKENERLKNVNASLKLHDIAQPQIHSDDAGPHYANTTDLKKLFNSNPVERSDSTPHILKKFKPSAPSEREICESYGSVDNFENVNTSQKSVNEKNSGVFVIEKFRKNLEEKFIDDKDKYFAFKNDDESKVPKTSSVKRPNVPPPPVPTTRLQSISSQSHYENLPILDKLRANPSKDVATTALNDKSLSLDKDRSDTLKKNPAILPKPANLRKYNLLEKE